MEGPEGRGEGQSTETEVSSRFLCVSASLRLALVYVGLVVGLVVATWRGLLPEPPFRAGYLLGFALMLLAAFPLVALLRGPGAGPRPPGRDATPPRPLWERGPGGEGIPLRATLFALAVGLFLGSLLASLAARSDADYGLGQIDETVARTEIAFAERVLGAAMEVLREGPR